MPFRIGFKELKKIESMEMVSIQVGTNPGTVVNIENKKGLTEIG
ncbi:hypothetical protein [Desulfobacula sp.]